jgi:hypothetical protein
MARLVSGCAWRAVYDDLRLRGCRCEVQVVLAGDGVVGDGRCSELQGTLDDESSALMWSSVLDLAEAESALAQADTALVAGGYRMTACGTPPPAHISCNTSWAGT